MAARTYHLKVLSSYGVFFDGECVQTVLPCEDGTRGILARHEDCIISVIPGPLRIKLPDETEQLAVVAGGYAAIDQGALTIIVDTAERPEDIDERRAREAAERAAEALKRRQSKVEYEQTKASLARAMARLRVKHMER
jgi:F-type H+-transporting ATPase subunit epsilon